jgi:phage terminase large subunit GpA-like protein
MPKRHNNIIYKLSLEIKKIIKVIPSSTTRIRLIIYIEDSEETFSINHIYIKKDTKVEETTVIDIITTTYPIRSDVIFIINLDTSQVSIQ